MKSIYDNDKVMKMALNGSMGPQLPKSVYDNDKVKALAEQNTANTPKPKSIYDNDKVKALAENQLVKRKMNNVKLGVGEQPSQKNIQTEKTIHRVHNYQVKRKNLENKKVPDEAYKLKYRELNKGTAFDNDFWMNTSFKLNNSKFLKGAQALMTAADPITNSMESMQSAENFVNKAIFGKVGEEYEPLKARRNAKVEAANEFKNIVGNDFVGDLGIAAADMVGNVGMAGMFSGGSASSLNPAKALTNYIAFNSGIQQGGEDLREGRKLVPSAVHGVGSGLITKGVESLSGIGQTEKGKEIVAKVAKLPVFKKLLENLNQKSSKYLGEYVSTFVGKLASEGLGETFEEGIEYPVQLALRNLLYEDKAPYDLKEHINNMLIGGGVGGLFGLSNATNATKYKYYQNKGNTKENVKQNTAFAENAEKSNSSVNSLPTLKERKINYGMQTVETPLGLPEHAVMIADDQGRISNRAYFDKHEFTEIDTVQAAKEKHRLNVNKVKAVMASNKYKKSRQPISVKWKNAQRDVGVNLNESYQNLRDAVWFESLTKNERDSLTEVLPKQTPSFYGTSGIFRNTGKKYNKKRNLSVPSDAADAVPQMYVQDVGKVPINTNISQDINGVNNQYTQNSEENSQRLGNDGIQKFLEFMKKNKEPNTEGEFFRRLREERNKNEVGNVAENLNNNIKENEAFESNNIPYENENKSFFSYLKELEQRYDTTDSDLLYNYLSDDERTEYERLSAEETEWSNRAMMDAFDENKQEKQRIEEKEKENKLLGSMGANSEFVKSTSETKSFLENSDLGELRDRAGELQHTRHLLNKDIARVLDTVSGKNKEMRNLLYKVIEKPLFVAKAKYTKNIKSNAKKIHEVFNDLGIKAKSRESAAVQWLGEGVRVNQQGEKTEYTLNDLKREFPQKWQDIVKTESFCRSMYDEYIKRINEMLSKVYPDVEERAQLYLSKQNERVTRFGLSAQFWEQRVKQISEKIDTVKAEIAKTRENTNKAARLKTRKLNLLNQLKNAKEEYERYIKYSDDASQKAIKQQRRIEKGEHLKNKRMPSRKDYYHHFEEIAEGLGGLKNILNTPMDIDSTLAGQSEFTKPKSKWWGAMQKRSENGSYTADALSGIAKYMTAAEYKIAFDPVIANLRATATAVAKGTENTKNANKFIDFLGEYANSIAGKTIFFDRLLQKFSDRRFMKALEKINGRVKSNAVMGNLSSALVQVGNLPNAFAYINNPMCFVKGAQEAVNNRELLNKSDFLNERYMSNEIEKMTEQTILSPRKLASWIMELGDKKAAEIIWLSARNNYLNKNGDVNMFRNYENEIDYADDITRRSVGGRGVGETPILQKSRLINFIAPFQLEVNNTYQLFKEQFGRKNALGLIEMQLGSWIINSIIESLNGNRPLPDLIDAFRDIFKDWKKDEEDDRTILTKSFDSVGRLGGEAVSAVPYVSQVLPNIADGKYTKAMFGENDPTRYGTGNILSNTIAKPIAQFRSEKNVDLLTPASMILPSFGGKQLDRSTKALQNWGKLPKLNFNTQEGFKISKNEFPASNTNEGNIRFPMEKNTSNFAKNFAFGSFATNEGKKYIEDGKKPLNEKQSEKMREAYRAGINPIEYYRVKNLMGKVSKNSEKYEILLKSPLNKKSREYLLNAFVTPSKTDRENIARFKVQGIPLEHYLKCKIEYRNLTEKFEDINERKMEFNKWIKLIPLSHEKQETIKEVFKTENILDQKLDGKFVNPNAQRKFNRVKITMGMNKEKFLKCYPIASDKELSQQQKIKNLQGLGLSEFEALSFILQMKK